MKWKAGEEVMVFPALNSAGNLPNSPVLKDPERLIYVQLCDGTFHPQQNVHLLFKYLISLKLYMLKNHFNILFKNQLP